MTLPEPFSGLRGRLVRNADRLVFFALLAGGAAWLWGAFYSLVPHGTRPFLDLPARFWLGVTLLWALALVAENFWTGIPHYAGWKKALALVDLLLLAVLTWGTGGLASPVYPVFYLQVVVMAIFGEERDLAEEAPAARGMFSRLAARVERFAPLYYLWYLPALAAAWFLPVAPWPALRGAGGLLGWPGFTRFLGLVGVAFLVRHLARLWRARALAEMGFAREAEERMRLAQYQTRLARQQAELVREGNRRREVSNWINLTAGLTHSIGNEVLAFDHYSREILEYLEADREAPPAIRESVQFIHDTNRARLGFIHFLQEFAEMMKLSADLRRVPKELISVDLARAIRWVREKVGRFESRELDPADSDSQVQKQLRKNLHLELIVHCETEDARVLSRGRLPVLDFVFYEFIKNSLRNCSGERRLKVTVAKSDGWVYLRFINDLDIEPRHPPRGGTLPCSACRAPHRELHWLRNSDHLDAFCDPCLKRKVEDNLRQCWTPGRSTQGGKGLGLFVIRHFLQRYYFGSTSAEVLNWDTREVFFQVVIPDDLESKIAEHNRQIEGRRRLRAAAEGRS